ncbi:MAG: radical SAM family heme chaperone HemW [Oscillospiraceae bacterium]|nr:radical SAM family heme chaperone HemW [Oscillospiraceae bacterium]
MSKQSLYIHVPFCARKCPYCDFYSLRGDNLTLQQEYIERCVDLLASCLLPLATCYIGGGTPSVLQPELLAKLLREIQCSGEFTIECNAASATREFAQVIQAGGVNRVSMGLQSIIPSERQALGRTRDFVLPELGIKNLSLDVMLGIPGQTLQSLQRTLEFCARAGATHVSAYLLKLEPGTPFAQNPPDLPCEDAQAELYLFACDWLTRHGFAQYEIANFALPGYASQHNLNYWRCGEYHAIGPGAHGFTGERRWHYPRDLQAFLQGEPLIEDGPGGDEEERAMLALRLSEGIAKPSDELRKRAKLLGDLVICDERGLRLTRAGMLLSNAVIGRLIA